MPVDADDLGGVVAGDKGPEAGVWVIAETTDLPTKFARIVVTDDLGRYLIPDLPKAGYSVWVRGYGLVDSPKVKASPGQALNLKAVTAPSPHAAADYYPAGYWFSLLKIPEKSEFPGTGSSGNGISPSIQTQSQWLRNLKSGGCTACHQLGNKATRDIPGPLGQFPDMPHAWERRLQSGQAGGNMMGGLEQLGRERALLLFGDWSDRVSRGELPPAPPRPQGVGAQRRHHVVGLGRPEGVPARRSVDGSAQPDRERERAHLRRSRAQRRLPARPRSGEARDQPGEAHRPRSEHTTDLAEDGGSLAVLGRGGDLDQQEQRPQSDARRAGPGLDHVRGAAAREPGLLQGGVEPSSAKLFPIERAGRHLAMYDPKTQKLTHISTCFGTHHLMFAEDANHTLWTSGGGQVVGWLNRKMYEETGDEVRSQGWTALIMDTNGNGKRDAYVEPNEPVDPAKDKRFGGAFYSVSPAPDGAVWGTVLGFPGQVIRLVPGSNPPETALAEVYEPPFADSKNPGYSPRGGDVDRNGVFWSALASGHLASFDRRKCKGPLNGPKATGQHCPEGWTLYTEPLPQFKGVSEGGSAEGSYYTWVDQFDTFGLGANTPINTGNASEALLALKDGKWVVLRVPYPQGFYTKWMDGRIDDPRAGWKGKGLWATVSTRAPFHMEGGKGTTSKVLKLQLRPDPLAK